jgi:hypothetical protein
MVQRCRSGPRRSRRAGAPCVGGGEGFPQTCRIFEVSVGWPRFVWQKAVFWIPLTRYKSKFTDNITGLLLSCFMGPPIIGPRGAGARQVIYTPGMDDIGLLNETTIFCSLIAKIQRICTEHDCYSKIQKAQHTFLAICIVFCGFSVRGYSSSVDASNIVCSGVSLPSGVMNE